MRLQFTLLLVFFSLLLTAQDRVYVHTSTASNSSGNVTYIDHPDINGNPNANLVISHVWNPGGANGVYNNNVSGLWYNSSNNRWAIYNENLSTMVVNSSYNVYIIASPANALTQIVTLANKPVPHITVIDDARFNNNNPGPRAVTTNYYNPNAVYNNSNYGFYYDTGINRRTIIEEGVNTIPIGAAYKVLINGGTGSTSFSQQTNASNITGNFTTINHPSLNGNPDATFVFSHHYGRYAGTYNYLDKVLGAFYNTGSNRWAIYTEDSSAMPVAVVFDIIVAPNTNLTYVPDDNFENYLETHDASGNVVPIGHSSSMGNGVANDNYVTTSKIDTVSYLVVESLSISDLTGIEGFLALQFLYCNNNDLTTLDFSQNANLFVLDCSINQITSINLTQNPNLSQLLCFSNQLTSLDLSQNTFLNDIQCSNNQLTSLDVTQNSTLQDLNCFNNQLTNLDVTQNLVLKTLNCSNNLLTSLDVISNSLLKELNCSSNQIANLIVATNTNLTVLSCWSNQLYNLDVTQNPLLTSLDCADNQLVFLNIDSSNSVLTNLWCYNNSLSSLDLSQNPALEIVWCQNTQLTDLNMKNGNNTAISNGNFRTENNPSLTCIEVDNAVWSSSNWTNIDPVSVFREDCSQTFVPDDNFEQALIDLGYDNVLDNYVYTSNINSVTSLDVSGNNIWDPTGIEDFTALQYLYFYNNVITTLDVSQNTALIELHFANNLISNIDVSNNTLLTSFNCSGNQLTSLDVSANTALSALRCYNNQLTSLDVSGNSALTILRTYNNQLTSLNVRNGNNTAISNANFITTTNPSLLCIQVDDATWSTSNWTNIDPVSSFSENCSMTYVPDDNFEQELIILGYDTVLDDYVITSNINTVTSLNVNGRSIADLTGIEDFTALQTLYCNNNLLTSLDVTQNTALSNLRFAFNQITTLDITQNTGLVYLDCAVNQLSGLDVTQNTALQVLLCEGNQLTSLDVSLNTSLTRLLCNDNLLTSLNVKNGNNTSISNADFNTTNNTNLSCIEVDNLVYSTINWTNIDATSNFSTDCSSTTYVPDDNFEQELIFLGYDMVLDNYVYTANINTVTSLNVNGRSILDLTGIEDFTALQTLYCNNNLLTSLDVTQNTALSNLRLAFNQLTNLDITQNTGLVYLDCAVNQLSGLDVTQNTALQVLLCEGNQLTSLDVSLNTSLTRLICNDNQLVSLNVKNGNNTAISNINFNATNNPNLICIEVDVVIWSTANWTNIDPTSTFGADCSLTYVPDDNFEQTLIDLGYDTVLDDYVLTTNINTIIGLDVNSRNIADLTGIEDFSALEILYCRNNQLTSLDFTQNLALTYLDCGINQLANVDITQNTVLEYLYCDNNQLANLDVSLNTILITLICNDNQLVNLNVKNGNNTAISNINFNASNNSNLFCIQVDDVAYSNANWTNKDPQANYNTICSNLTIWLSGAWTNGAPTIFDDAIIRDNYSTAIQGANIEANNLIIDAGFTLTIENGDYLRVNNNLTVNGNLTIEHEGSFVQLSNTATVTNNGNIQVLKDMTSFDAGTDFAILGSPMTGETRDGVYSQNNVTMNHLTSNFIPNAAVASDDPLAENFADDNGNNWQFFTGSENIIPGAGYLVGGITGGGNFTSTYTQGTLNNGIINFNTIYNGSQNASPNVLSNPYASAIDAWQFIDNNSVVDAVYFWEHLTPPSASYPGYRSENWDMGDISMYNLSGGISAVNGGSAPSWYIPSGQGFSIKANAFGMVTFDNSLRVTGPNTGYRNSENTNRMYVNVSNETYGLKSSTLIAFIPNATDGIEASYDAKRLATPVSIYSIVEEQELAIQGRSTFNEDQVIFLGFRTQVEELQEYTISLGLIEGTEITTATIYLQDNLLHIATNLTETNYSFTSDDGNFSDRFLIYFREESLGVYDVTSNSISIYPNPTQDKITISSINSEIKSFTIFDLQGRKIINKTVNDFQTTFNISSFNNAIYLLKIETERGTVIKRMIKN